MTIEDSDALDHVFSTDWDAVGGAVHHLIAGIALQKSSGRLALVIDRLSDGGVSISIAESEAGAASISVISLNETFDHDDDASPTKYGGTGIEIALAHKFTQLLGGDIRPVRLVDGRPAIRMTIPDLSLQALDIRKAA
jgi:signal transduction histidine kinase